MSCLIRLFEPADLPQLAEIYRESIRQRGDEYYSAKQIAAWASHADDTTAFTRWITSVTTFVAIDAHQNCIGFGGLEPSGRIASLFVAPEVMRQGVGSALLERLLAEVKARGLHEATTDASEFSKPLFEKFGFEVLDIERTIYHGVDFTRYAMRWRDSSISDD